MTRHGGCNGCHQLPADSWEIQGAVAKHYDGPQADQKQMQLEETGGIPTGVAPDIHRQVELRKAKRAAPPDNLAMEPADSSA